MLYNPLTDILIIGKKKKKCHVSQNYCSVLVRLNHSLMGGLVERYCYSLWELAVHTNRRL